MTKPIDRQTPSSAPWWLRPGVEMCGLCEADVHAEALRYCARCDRPTCPLCVAPDDADACRDCAAQARVGTP